jgi:putative transcriptional regulator
MLDKYFLLNKIVKFLIRENFNVLVTEGSFDVAARREKLLLLKILLNIDALQKEHALTLLAVSHFVSAYPFVISEKSNREILGKNIIYSRFGVPVVTHETFENILKEGEPFVFSAKGRHTVEIDCEKMRNMRKELGYSLSELSKLVGISKKALYEIENKKVNPTKETLERLEDVLQVKLTLPFKPEVPIKLKLKPKNKFQEKVVREFSRIGIESTATYSAPFEIIGKEKSALITRLSRNTVKIKKEVDSVKRLSSIFSSKAFFVVKRIHEKTIKGIPVILDKELKEIETIREFNKLIKEREA